ncbi:hypothetical protein C2G38_2142445 [Gigaspora rosea]|uniref:Uncharacterized protein n=1 Tax=Gigaspora rosea TaxID=44941 RepID=A0A397VA08_9GLOM|nr:hypothetical protein C2G38_2142445 [Gigaspora rosea]
MNEEKKLPKSNTDPDTLYGSCCLFWFETDRSEKLYFSRFRRLCQLIIYSSITAYIIYYIISFSGPSHEEISRSIKNVPVPSILFISYGANFNITNIQCINNTALSSCDDKITSVGNYFFYSDENLLPDFPHWLEFRIYTDNSISSQNDDSNLYPNIILIDPDLVKQLYSDDLQLLKSSNPLDKMSSITLQNYYFLSPFQIHTVLLERIEFQNLDISLENGSAEDIIYKDASEHLVHYFGYSSKMMFSGQLNNSIFLNGSSSSRLYATLQIQSMSSILTTFKQVNKVSSTTVVAFLSGLGGSTSFLLVIYKFCFGGHRPQGLLKPLLKPLLPFFKTS